MKSKNVVLAIPLALFALCGSVSANENYFGGGLSFIDYSENGIGSDASLTTITARIGSKFNENFSGEFRAGFGIGDDTVSVFDTDVNLDLNNYYGVYLLAGIPVSENFYPYAALGYSRGEVEASAMGFSASESESDVSFGFGADIKVSDKFDINIEYMNYLDKNGAELSGFSLGFTMPF